MADASTADKLGRPFKWPRDVSSGAMVGVRCTLTYGSGADFGSLIHRFGDELQWPTGRTDVSVRFLKDDGTVELHATCPEMTPQTIKYLGDCIEIVRDQLSRETSKTSPIRVLSVEREFVIVKLPKWLEPRLTPQVATAGIAVGLSSPPTTVSIVNGILSMGPEAKGALFGLQRFIEQQFTYFQTGRRIEAISGASELQMPIVLAGMLLATWAFPLSSLTLAISGAAMSIPIIIMAVRARSEGWRAYMLRPGALTAIVLYVIALFGIGYGICALPSATQPSAEPLGNSFLIATSMGLAGGVIGDALKGPALRIAHVQLLLFLGTFVIVIVKLLRIDALLRTRE